jgi:hypothetical protein
VAELADAPDLGSGGFTVQVQVLSPAPNKKNVSSTVFLFGLHHFSRPSRIGTDVLLCKTEK